MTNNRSKIIMLDDNAVNSSSGRKALDTFFEVYPAPTAAVFFEILEKVVPDLILLDMELPDIDGDAGKPEGFRLGAADCIERPFSGPFLLKRIVNQLLIVQKDKVTAVRGKAGTEVMEKLNALTDKKKHGGEYVKQSR